MKRHPNFTGSSILASSGYAILYVGKRHHLADIRGYAYVHRLEAEKKLGTKLKPGQVVHHINGDKLDNAHSNLEILKSNGLHLHFHGSRRNRKPGEDNPLVVCACGCGREFHKFDKFNRPRKYANGCNASSGKGKRNSDEKVECACGCGASFLKYDRGARERKFLNGHNNRKIMA